MRQGSLGRRTVFIGVVSAVLGVALIAVSSRLSGRRTIGTGLGSSLGWLIDREERARCEAAPERWHLDGPAHQIIWAYDPVLKRSHNLAAPVLVKEAWQGLEQNDMVIVLFGLGVGGSLFARLAPSGPCAVMGVSWQSIYPASKVYLGVLACAVAAAVAGAVLTSLGVVRPLAHRLALVRQMASRVGAASGYSPVEAEASDDLGQLAHELDIAHTRIRHDAAELARQRGELQRHIADVAHDLRTPLASLQLALQQALSSDRREADGALVRAVQDVVYVGGLVANLRLASEFRGDALPATTGLVSLGETVERATLRIQFLARQKRVGLEMAVPDSPLMVAGDPIAVEQAIANVIENAVTHNGPDGHVAVMVEEQGEEFQLSVTDDGPGVEPGELPRLGERTFRADAARQRDARGQGLGLAITSEVCRRLGWRLTFSAQEPTGLRVTLRGSRAPA